MAFQAEIAPSRGYPPQGLVPDIPWSPEFTPQSHHEQEAPSDELSLQVDVKERLMHLLGPDYTPAMSLNALRERGKGLGLAIDSVPQQRLNDGSLGIKELSEIGDRSSCLRIAAAVIANKFEINLHGYIEKKLMEKMQVKYRPDDVTEIRFYGTPDNPGVKSGPQALALLKGSFDDGAGAQRYSFRGLPIPESEEAARTPARIYGNHFQDLAYWWQIKSLGKDLIPSERYTNVISQGDGEVDEVLGVFEGMTDEQINAIVKNKADYLPLFESLGGELADVFIGTWCGDSAAGIDSDAKDNERMGIAAEKYADGPKLRRLGIEPERRLRWMDIAWKRIRDGLNPPPPLVAATVRSRRN